MGRDLEPLGPLEVRIKKPRGKAAAVAAAEEEGEEGGALLSQAVGGGSTAEEEQTEMLTVSWVGGSLTCVRALASVLLAALRLPAEARLATKQKCHVQFGPPNRRP